MQQPRDPRAAVPERGWEEDGRRASQAQRDLVVDERQYVLILDETNGQITCHVGPTMVTLQTNAIPVYFDPATRSFVRTEADQAIKPWIMAREGSYIVLQDPSRTPPERGANKQWQLETGRTINIPGPMSFPLWPGQVAEVIPGHNLRSNQYLVVKVYNPEAAKENWGKAVIKPQTAVESTEQQAEGSAPAGPSAAAEVRADETEAPELTMGQLLVVKGTEVSFYIPPTGIEVVKDEPTGKMVRDAVTLEQLEYCILLGEDGVKRYVTGPAVVFPSPTETFVTVDGSQKFKAIELNALSGVYVKVTKTYLEEGSITVRKEGEELFITGEQQSFYIPRPEHSLIKYGDRIVHHAIAIPEGEGRYVLDRNTGKIELVRGPVMFLPDPRKQVVVRRILNPSIVELLYPGNRQALQHNQMLAQMAAGQKEDYVEDTTVRTRGAKAAGAAMLAALGRPETADLSDALRKFASEEVNRGTQYTPPRTITLDTKFDGAVGVEVWPGYAIMLIKKSGSRRVVVGPDHTLLDYDEDPLALGLSTGTPKSDERPLRTAFLKVRHNTVSDIIDAETSDLVKVRIRVSYRVNFEGEDHEKWFDEENYVKLLTDHLRSLLRNAVKRYTIEEFHGNAIDIVRDTVLGKTPEGGGTRLGRPFNENNMRIYDLEVLDLTIGDDAIKTLLVSAQHDAVQKKLEVAQAQRRKEAIVSIEAINREIADAKAETMTKELNIKETEAQALATSALQRINEAITQAGARLKAELEAQADKDHIHSATLARDKADADQRQAIAQATLLQKIEELQAEAEAVIKKAGAISPTLAAALQGLADKDLIARAAEAMGPYAYVGDTSALDVLRTLLKGSGLEGLLDTLQRKVEENHGE